MNPVEVHQFVGAEVGSRRNCALRDCPENSRRACQRLLSLIDAWCLVRRFFPHFGRDAGRLVGLVS